MRFHLGDLLSVYTNRLVSRDHIDGVYNVLNHMTGASLQTGALPAAGDQAKPELEKQFPWLKDARALLEADFAAGNVELTQAGVDAYVDGLANTFGEYHDVEPMRQSVDKIMVIFSDGKGPPRKPTRLPSWKRPIAWP